MKKQLSIYLVLLVTCLFIGMAVSQEGAEVSGSEEVAVVVEPAATQADSTPAADSTAINAYAIDNFFVFITGVLVIFMQAGFALVETGLNSAKNSVNILFKNLIDFVMG